MNLFHNIAAMQNADQNDILSWFQVAGIHGYPFIAYDGANGVNGFQANPANQAAGYCTHGSTLFPTWHRPYTMLVEVGLFSAFNLLWQPARGDCFVFSFLFLFAANHQSTCTTNRCDVHNFRQSTMGGCCSQAEARILGLGGK